MSKGRWIWQQKSIHSPVCLCKYSRGKSKIINGEGEQPSRLAWMLQPPRKINDKNVLQHIDRLNAIESLALPDGIVLSVHQNRLLKLAREGRKMSSQDLAKFTDVRRYASLVYVISEARAILTDEVIDLHERILGSLFSREKRTQAERLQQTGKLIQSKLKQYVTVGQEFINNVEETRLLSRKDNFDPLHLITEKYSTLRKYSPGCCPHCSSGLHPPQCSSVTRLIPSERCIENNSEKYHLPRQPGLSRKAGERW